MSSQGSHLGDLAAALVDDQLDPTARDYVLGHIAGCAGCRAEVEAQRRLKSRLQALTTPGLPTDLASRLASLAGTGKPPLSGLGGDGPRLAAVAPIGAEAAVSPRPGGSLSFLRDSRRGRRLLAGAASVLLVGVGTAVAAANDTQAGGPARQSSTSFTNTQTVSVRGSQQLSDPAFDAMTASYGR